MNLIELFLLPSSTCCCVGVCWHVSDGVGVRVGVLGGSTPTGTVGDVGVIGVGDSADYFCVGPIVGG